MIELDNCQIDIDSLYKSCNKDPNEHTFFVKPRVKKFMDREINKAEPVFIDSSDLDGFLFMDLLDMHQEFPSEITITIEEHQPGEIPNAVCGVDDTDKFFDKEIKKALFQWVIDSIVSGGFAMSGIRLFLEYYNISEDDYAELSVHRAWMRYYHREYQKERLRRQMKKKLDVTK